MSSQARSRPCVTAPCAQRDVSRTRPHLAIIFKLAEAAERSWRRFDGHNQVPKIIFGVRFADGIEVVRLQVQAAATDPFRHQDSAIAPRFQHYYSENEAIARGDRACAPALQCPPVLGTLA